MGVTHNFLENMDLKSLLLFSLLIFPELCYGSIVKEIEVVTASCENCGMTFLGELSVKICGQGQAPSICCVVANIDNDDDNFEEGATDVFTGNDLKECNNFDLGNVVSPDQFSLVIYHAGSDGGTFDFVSVITNDGKELICQFKTFLDGSSWEAGYDCQVI